MKVHEDSSIARILVWIFLFGLFYGIADVLLSLGGVKEFNVYVPALSVLLCSGFYLYYYREGEDDNGTVETNPKLPL